jgi:hypothetical protein
MKVVIPGFLLYTEENHEMMSRAGVPAEIRTEQLPHTDQKDYGLSQLAQSIDRALINPLVVHDMLHVPRECDDAACPRPRDIIRSVWMQSAAC